MVFEVSENTKPINKKLALLLVVSGLAEPCPPLISNILKTGFIKRDYLI